MCRVALVRIAAVVPLLFGVSLVSFCLLQLAPGSFIDALLLDPTVPAETLNVLTSRYGLDKPWHEQYVSWLGGALRGDLGFSIAYQRPVAELIGESAIYTLALAVSSGVIASAGGLALALFVSLRPGGFSDRALSALALVVISAPVLVLAIGALGLAAATGALPLGGGSTAGISEVDYAARVSDFAYHLLLPTTVLSISLGPVFFLQARGALHEVLASEFAHAARSRGLTRARVLFKHCLRAALTPVLTFAGSSVARILNGAFLVEVVTQWPGMGRLAWRALVARDCFLVLGVLILASTLLLLGNLAADLSIAVADPRIRLEEE